MAAGSHFDVITVSDLRLPGGTAASIAEELTAQHAAGLRSGVIHVGSRLVARERPFNPRIRAHVEAGAAEVLVGPIPVSCDLLILRHPAVMLDVDPSKVARVDAKQVVLVANQSPGTPEGQVVHYDPSTVTAAVHAWTGADPTWVPIGPLVRGNLGVIAPDLRISDDDWVNIIDVDRWEADRSHGPGHPIVIGRHSRDHPTKWPSDPEVIRAVYPDRADIRVHILGGAEVPKEILGGRLPTNWTVLGFGEEAPERFLSGIDVLVYYHHPDWVEAFGRTILEALASGAVAVLPGQFRPLFGDACLYAEPEEVERTVRSLASDPDRYRELSQRGHLLARERFSHDAHVARLSDRLGVSLSRSPAPIRPQRPPRVLFVSSNGAGVGHLMRLMAMARRARSCEPLFLTLSQAIGVVHDQGYPVEYLPSRQYMGGASPPWHQLLRSRLTEMVDEHDVRVVVFDGTWPYEGFLDLRSVRPDVQLVWSRRAMWKPGVVSPGLDEVDRFSLVIEPGEYAEESDQGVTRSLRHQVTRVAPITFLDPDEQLDGPTARKEIGLDPDRPAALVQLGAGNINDTSSLLGLVISRLAEEPGMQICVTRSAIAAEIGELEADIHQLSVYPLARYLRAFDLAVAASGYNTYHELLATPVPTLFVPNLETSTDDQLARARFAERLGVGRCLTQVTPGELDSELQPLLDPTSRRRMQERAEVRRPENGATAAMKEIEKLLGAQSTDTSDVAPGQQVGQAPPPVRSPQPSTTEQTPVRVPTLAERSSKDPSSKNRQVRTATSVKQRLARAASKSGFRRIGRAPFRALPRPAQAAVRRRLRRWDRSPRTAARTRLPVPSGAIDLQEEERATPIMLTLSAGIQGDEFEQMVRAVAGLQVTYRGFAPLFVCSSRDVGVLRGYGYLFEYLPARETWPGDTDAHTRYVRDRMVDIVARYRPQLTINLRSGDDPQATLVPLLRTFV